MESEVRYCTSEDGARIAYCVVGEGLPVLVCPLFVESFALDHLYPEYDRFMRQFGADRCLIRFDARGTGLSQRDVLSVGVEGTTLDLEAVVRASSLPRVAVWAPGIAGPRAINFAVRHPALVSHLILYDTFADAAEAFPDTLVRAVHSLALHDWELASQMLADMSLRDRFPEAALALRDVIRRSIDGADWVRMAEGGASGSSVAHLLGEIAAPTLVLHKRDDGIVPFALGQELAAAIPSAKFVPLEGVAHDFALEDADVVLEAVDTFLGDRSRGSGRIGQRTSGVVHTVLFTDLVAHTEMMQRLGDDKGRQVLREYERMTRELVKHHGGKEIKSDGDRFMVSFGSVTAAVDCAIGLQRAFAARNEAGSEPLHVRMGLNAGEPVQEDGDLFGSSVIIAARVAEQAAAGEILIPEPVRHLLAGKSVVFANRGEITLKGFDDAVRLYEVRWRE